MMEDFDHEQCQRLYFDWDGDTAHPPTNSLRNETVSSCFLYSNIFIHH